MNKLIPGILLSFVFTLSAFSADVEIGMPEAKLLEAKGKPEWSGSSGRMATYSWPDMRVSVTDGKVDRVELRDVQKEKKIAAEKKAQELAKHQFVVVVDVLSDGGALVRFLEETQSSQAAKLDRLPGLGYLGRVSTSVSESRPSRYLPSGRPVYMIGLGQCAIGDRLSISASAEGFYKSTLGTIPKFTVCGVTRM